MCKSPFLWPGSKGKPSDLKQIGRLIPYHICYLEVMVGGGSVLFNFKKPGDSVVISDVNHDLIDCYLSMRDQPEKMIELLPCVFPKQEPERYKSLWQAWKDCKPYTTAERGVRFLFLNRTSFQGLGGMLKPEDTRYNRETLIQRIKQGSKILSNSTIRCQSAFDTITNYDSIASFIFLDPPYVATNNEACYKHDQWNDAKLADLASLLGTVKGKWLMTINDRPLVRELFSKFNMLSYDWVKRQVRRKKQKDVELYIANYEIRAEPTEVQVFEEE